MRGDVLLTRERSVAPAPLTPPPPPLPEPLLLLSCPSRPPSSNLLLSTSLLLAPPPKCLEDAVSLPADRWSQWSLYVRVGRWPAIPDRGCRYTFPTLGCVVRTAAVGAVCKKRLSMLVLIEGHLSCCHRSGGELSVPTGTVRKRKRSTNDIRKTPVLVSCPWRLHYYCSLDATRLVLLFGRFILTLLTLWPSIGGTFCRGVQYSLNK